MYPDMDDLERDRNDQKLAPVNTNSFMSDLFFSWLNPLIWKGYKSPLTQDDLFNIPKRLNVDENVKHFEEQKKLSEKLDLLSKVDQFTLIGALACYVHVQITANTSSFLETSGAFGTPVIDRTSITEDDIGRLHIILQL